MKSVKVRDLNPVSQKLDGVYNRFDESFNLLLNSVKIVNKNTQEQLDFVSENYIKTKLFDKGAVGYDKSLLIK